MTLEELPQETAQGSNAWKSEVSTLESERIRAEARISREEDTVMWADGT